jgi:hypothetical protein
MKRLLPSTLAAALIALAPLALAQTPPPQPQPEEQQFHAFAVVTASGKAAREGTKERIEATLSGPFFIETDEGPIHSGKISCTSASVADTASARTEAKGSCIVTAEDGATSTGQFDCAGYSLIGCRGSFKIVSGTARFADVVGEATIVWRPTSTELKAQIASGTIKDATGLLMFRDFKVVHGKK